MVGYCRLSRRRQGWGPVSDAQMAEGLSLARQAIEAGEDDADALWIGGYVVAVFANYRITAAAVICRASMLNQNSAHAWNAKGWVLCFGGESDAAIDAFQHAMGIATLFTSGVPTCSYSPIAVVKAAVPRPPPRRPAGGPQVRPRQNPRSIRGTTGTS